MNSQAAAIDTAPPRRRLRSATWPTPSARSPWTPCRRRIPAIPACRWAWPTSRRCCSTASSSIDPSRPDWPDRDRFVLSAGHGSMLQYALHHLLGYEDMPIEELQRFRQLGSRTAGHPEYGHALGIETTTGPLGQGIATAVGMALAERMLAARFGADLVDHYTYVIAGDGCLQEGISHEAIDLAGHLRLGRLIVFWDDNSISIDGPTSLSTSMDQPARFAAAGWHVHAGRRPRPGGRRRGDRGRAALRPAVADRLPDGDRQGRAQPAGLGEDAWRAARRRPRSPRPAQNIGWPHRALRGARRDRLGLARGRRARPGRRGAPGSSGSPHRRGARAFETAIAGELPRRRLRGARGLPQGAFRARRPRSPPARPRKWRSARSTPRPT